MLDGGDMVFGVGIVGMQSTWEDSLERCFYLWIIGFGIVDLGMRVYIDSMKKQMESY
jgi:hypothetical protein